MPVSEIKPFVSGAILCIVFLFVLSQIKQQYPFVNKALTKTDNTRQTAIFLLNIVIVAIGISISVSAVTVEVGGSEMNAEQISELLSSAQSLIHLVYALAGVAAGAVIVWVIGLIRAIFQEKKNGTVKENQEGKPNQKDNATTISLSLTGNITDANTPQLNTILKLANKEVENGNIRQKAHKQTKDTNGNDKETRNKQD